MLTRRIRSRARYFLLLAVAAITLALPPAARAQGRAGDLKLDVVELARSVDLSRGKEQFLTVTIDISGVEAARLRRVQPLRDDFQVLAGKRTLLCRWLRGGTLPDDPARLRFVLGFSTPPKGTRQVSLRANLPRLEGEDELTLTLDRLSPGELKQERSGPGWSVRVERLVQQDYTPPAVPEKGQFTVKSIPIDTRVFRKPARDPDPAQVYTLVLLSRSADLYDATLDVSGWLAVENGAPAPLLSAMMRRTPSRGSDRPLPPFVRGEFHFPVPPKGKIAGAVLRFHRRPPNPKAQPVVISGLPVPGP